jgi:hypothetical protein
MSNSRNPANNPFHPVHRVKPRGQVTKPWVFEPPKATDNYTLKMLLDICRWMDGLEQLESRREYFATTITQVDFSALENELLRKQVNLLWSIHCEKEELRQTYRQMDLGENTHAIKTKIKDAEARFKDEYETYIMYLKLSSDKPVDGYYFTIIE